MKFTLTLLCIPLLFVSCLNFTSQEEETNEEETTENTAEAPEESEETEDNEEETHEITPVDITGDAFIANFFTASYEYKGVSLYSTYDYMINQLGEPEESGEMIDGTYYSYGPIAFNFPAEVNSETSDTQVDGIIVFPEDFYKTDAVEYYGWPTSDEPEHSRMIYDDDTENDYYIMLFYNHDDQITEIILHNQNLQDTDFYTE